MNGGMVISAAKVQRHDQLFDLFIPRRQEGVRTRREQSGSDALKPMPGPGSEEHMCGARQGKLGMRPESPFYVESAMFDVEAVR